MESTNRALSGQLNISRTPAKSHLLKTIGAMAMGAMLAASIMLSASTASADERNKPLIKEQVTNTAPWDVYADARDIRPKLVQIDSDFDAYVDARDIQNSGTRAKLMPVDSGFDEYVDARDIQNSGTRANFSALH